MATMGTHIMPSNMLTSTMATASKDSTPTTTDHTWKYQLMNEVGLGMAMIWNWVVSSL